jgi:hypothetical protein
MLLAGGLAIGNFGLFKKKQPTVMDAMIRLVYGANPPSKSADLERSIAIAYRDLLCEQVPLSQVKQLASELFKGPVPYSTLDLAVSTALGIFKDPEYVPVLQECQLVARLRVAEWTKGGMVPPLLAQSFEEVLYRLYKPQLSPKPTAMEPDHRQLPKGSTDGLGWGPPQMAGYYSVITRAISALPPRPPAWYWRRAAPCARRRQGARRNDAR